MPLIRDFVSRTAATPAGNAWTKVPASDLGREGVWLANLDASYSVWVRFKGSGDSAPSDPPADGDQDAVVPAGQTVWFQLSKDVAVYACNSSGAATTSKLTVRETL